MQQLNKNNPDTDGKENLGSTVFEVAKAFSSIQDVDTLLSEISSSVERLTNSEAASILLLDAAKQQLVFRVATGEKGASMKRFYVPLGKGVAGWVAENKEAVIINDVKSDTRFTGQIDKSSGFSTRSIIAIPMISNGELIGVAEALNKIDGEYTDADQKIMADLATLAATTILNARTSEDYRNFFNHTLELLTIAIEGQDNRMAGHSYRVAELACRIGREMGLEGDAYRDLYYAAILHDIGMIATHDLKYLPNVTSQSPSRTPMELHPLVGAELVKNIRLFSRVPALILNHHEYIDGTGYPNGVSGNSIPLGARILCLVEHLDELQMSGAAGSNYQSAAEKLALAGVGTKFDKSVVAAYLSLSK